MSNFYRTATFTGLTEFDYIVQEAGNYTVRCKLELPSLIVPTPTPGAGGGAGTGTNAASTQAIPSQVVTIIKLNSTTKLTSAAGDRGASVDISGASAGDTIKVILSSSLAQDNQPEAVKCTVAIYEI